MDPGAGSMLTPRCRGLLGLLEISECFTSPKVSAHVLHRAFDPGFVFRGPHPGGVGDKPGMAGVVEPARGELRIDRVSGRDHRLHVVRNEDGEYPAEELPGRFTPGDHRRQGLRVSQPHEHVPAEYGGKDQRIHLAAPAICGVGEHPQIAEIDLAFHTRIAISDPDRGVLAAETATLTGESVQRAIRHHTSLPGQQRVDLGDRQRPLLTLTGHPRGDLLFEPRQLFPRRAVPIRADRAHRLSDRTDQPVIKRSTLSSRHSPAASAAAT